MTVDCGRRSVHNIDMTENNRPKVGLGLLLLKDGHILLGKRLGSHGNGEFGATGGHLEGNESFEECATRELVEEAGTDMKITVPKFLCVTNLKKYPPHHYVDIGMVAEWISGDPVNEEPDKMESWNWYPVENLPDKLFGCMENYLEAYRTGKTYFESA